MASEGEEHILIGERPDPHHVGSEPVASAAANNGRMRIPLALSSDDLSELTAALTSYIERQSLATVRD